MAEKVRVLSGRFNREGRSLSVPLNKRIFILCLLGFLLGRAGILEGLTPFGIGLFTALNYRDRRYALVGIPSFLGIISVQGISGSIPYGISLAVIYLLFKYVLDLRRLHTLKAGFISGFSYLTVAMIVASFGNLYIYDIFMMAFEGLIILAIVYIFAQGLPIFMEYKNRRLLSSEEIICITILIALALSGVSNVEIFHISPRNTLAVFLTLLLAYNGGASVGGSVGITLGLITTMSSYGIPPVVIGLLGFSGLLAGVFKDLGKIGTGLGFLMGNIILTFYISGYTESYIYIGEIFIALAFLLLLPQSWMGQMEGFWKNSKNLIYSDKSHGERMKRRIYGKLTEYSNTFHQLANTFDKISDKYEIFEREELTNLIQEMADHVCHNCGRRRTCWENNFAITYQGMVDLMVLIETGGHYQADQLPEALAKRCIHQDRVIEKMTHLYELSHLDMTWRQRFVEGRELVGEQFKGLSQSIGEMAEDLNKKLSYNIDLENQIHIALDKEGLWARDIVVLEDGEGGMEITIEKRPCYNRQSCVNKFIPIISKLVGLDLVKKNTGCNYQGGREGCSFTLVEANKFTAVTKVAKVSKDGNILSGDSYSFMEVKDHQYLVALSDGMGSGERAYRQSNATISMLEKMMEAGFDKEVAIKSINSLLMLKSSEEIFSSLDMALINLCKGKVDFVKVGSPSSYIKRGRGGVENITASTLPIGILKNIEFNEEIQSIEDGDFIILLSDGIIEANKEGGDWLPTYLATLDTRNPQDLADKILHQALKYTNNQPKDDMTVLVTKIWKRGDKKLLVA